MTRSKATPAAAQHLVDSQHATATRLPWAAALIAAAVILAVVMISIGTSRVTNTKMLGLGIAPAVLMDAMIVRSPLVPAAMKLTGRATWWAPGPLRRFHDRFGLREAEDERPSGARGCINLRLRRGA